MAKRFYKTVDTFSDDQGWGLHLDGRALKTPGKKALRVPNDAIAQKIAAEWDAVTDEIDPAVMPITRLANVAAEGLPARRQALIDDVTAYAGTDLLSYRAPDPQDYVARQAAAWDPWLDWAAGRGVRLETTQSIAAIEQPPESLSAMRNFASAQADFSLTLLAHLTAVYGSAILAMAVRETALPPDAAFDLSRLDEIYRAEIWGVDEDDDAVRQALRAETITLGNLALDL